jgi:hypothetical protein
MILIIIPDQLWPRSRNAIFTDILKYYGEYFIKIWNNKNNKDFNLNEY